MTADAARRGRRTERTALVVLSHVAYRSAWLADARGAHPDRPRRGRAGALGPVPLGRLGARRARRRGASTSRSGAPTSTSTAGPARRRSATSPRGTSTTLTQPIQGWMGAADPFLMGPGYTPAAGHPPVPVRHARRSSGCSRCRTWSTLIDEVGMAAVREKSVALTSYAIDARRRGPGAARASSVASPRDPARRGGHVTLAPPADARGRPPRSGSAT